MKPHRGSHLHTYEDDDLQQIIVAEGEWDASKQVALDILAWRLDDLQRRTR